MSRDENGRRAAVIYLRQSLDRLGTEDAVTRQREDAVAIAASRGFRVIAIHADNDTSARGRSKRPGFDATLADVEAGNASVIIAWNMDRLTRNSRDRLRLIETGRKAKALVVLARGSDIDLSTPSGRMTADILASVAQAEIETKSDRQKRANLQAVQRGRRVGGRRPFGFEQDGKTLRLDEADAIRDGYHAYLAGSTLAAIARDWNARGFTAQKAPWAGYSVAMILKNPRYMGWRGYAPADENRKGRPVIEAVTQAEWPAIVTENIWHGVNGMLASKATSAVSRGGRYLLTGVAWCALCDVEGQPSTVHGGGAVRHYPMYRCSRTYGHVSRKAEPIDRWVSAYAVARLSRKDARELLTSASSEPGIGELRAEYKSLLERKRKLAEDLALTDMDPGDYREMREAFRRRLGELETAMAGSGRASILRPLIDADNVEAMWDAMPRAHQRQVIDSIFTVTLYPAGQGTRTFRPETVRVEPKREKQALKTQPVLNEKRRIRQ